MNVNKEIEEMEAYAKLHGFCFTCGMCMCCKECECTKNLIGVIKWKK